MAIPDPTGRAVPGGYLSPGPFTDPRDLAPRLRALAARAGPSPAALAEAVRSVMIHAHWRARYGLPDAPARALAETNLRSLHAMLERLGALQAEAGRAPDDVSPLPPGRRLIGNCRDHSVLYAALLRAVGVPARARCGFGSYFLPGHLEDHWVVERWDGARWAISDPQLDGLMREALGIGFDPMDLPDGAFVSGGEAWLACRAGDDPERYGIFAFHGWDFVKGNLVRDVCALAGQELLPWDTWGHADAAHAGLPPAALEALDAAARATPMRAALDAPAAAALAAAPGFRLPRRIRSWPQGEAVEVDLGPILDG